MHETGSSRPLDKTEIERPARCRGSSVLRVERYLSKFEHATPYTVGIEDELILVDPATLEPAAASEQVLRAFDGNPRVLPELRSTQIELITPVCLTAREAGESLADLRSSLRRRLSGEVAFFAAGAHPTATDPGPLSDRPRYQQVGRDCPWAEKITLTCGLHVHVAVPGAERALAVYNALRSYLPLIAALAVNSPFYGSEDSGMDSIRWKLNAGLARFGIPPSFSSWEAYADFVDWAARGGVMSDPSYQWWDMRLSPTYGTIEVRIADSQTRVSDAAAIAAFVQTLAAWLAERADSERRLPVHPGERIHENAWLAVRDGCRGHLADLETGERRPTADLIASQIEKLIPIARALDCERELGDAMRLTWETGADRQRRIARLLGIHGLVRWLCSETSSQGELDERLETETRLARGR
jgi:carboxylate-amine ligase